MGNGVTPVVVAQSVVPIVANATPLPLAVVITPFHTLFVVVVMLPPPTRLNCTVPPPTLPAVVNRVSAPRAKLLLALAPFLS